MCSAHRDFRSPPEWCVRHLSQHASGRHLQRSDEGLHDQYHNLYLDGPGITPVAGTVTYDASTDVATFTPTSALALSTVYTATITTGAQDLAGDPLAADYVWTFTTATTACHTHRTVGNGLHVWNSGRLHRHQLRTATRYWGYWRLARDFDHWISAGTLTGTEHAGDAVAQTAQGDLTTAYNFAAAAAGGAVLPADIGGETLAPGVYKTTSAQPSLGITGNLTLSGNANGVCIFQIVSTLTTAANNSQVILSWRRPVGKRVLAGRQFGDAWNYHNIRRNHYGSGVRFA